MPSGSASAASLNQAVHSSLEKILFQNVAHAAEMLAQVSERVSPELAAAIPSLLTDSPDPDSALIMLERLTGQGDAVLRLLNQHHFLAHYAIVVFGHSHYLGETLLQDPDLLQSLGERNLDRSLSHEELCASLARFRSRSLETDVSLLLAGFKRREYVRIMLRDCLKLAPLAETTAEISALADVLIQDALREAESQLERRYGTPRHRDSEGRLVNTPFVVLSLGKLGGYELNYNSDVDLLYVFGDGEEPPDIAISNHEYFVRLAQQLTQILSRVTEAGPVFRIDMRLRPQGSQGELAVSLSHALGYYAETAQDWERQALIKARYSAGSRSLARSFLRGVQPYVYVEYEEAGRSRTAESRGQGDGGGTPSGRVNFAATETALQSRERMHRRRRGLADPDAGERIDVKFDHGGIRDIEFLVQCLQRVYGGREPWLRSGGTLFSLQKLHDKQHLSSKEFHELTTTYEFLRHVEHRLQLWQGQQTHHLPSSHAELRALQKSLSGCLGGEDQIDDIHGTLRCRMAAVSEIYNRIIHSHRAGEYPNSPEAEFELRNLVEPAVDHAHRQLLERLSADSPELHAIARREDLSAQARRNLFRFLSSALTSSQRYAAVRRHAQALEKALLLFDTSDHLSEILIRHPEEIATLAELENLSARVGSDYLFRGTPGGRADGGFGHGEDYAAAVSDPVFAYIAGASNSYSEKLSLLRRHYRHRVFAAGVRDITELRDVYLSLGSTSAAAEDAIATAFRIAGAPEGLAVMALGRLGTVEFDVFSDADMLFVYEEGRDAVGLTKSAEKLMQVLSAYTREGIVFTVDTRLRPRGHEGDLLQTPSQLESYFQHEAQPWEAMTYTKLRFLAGSQTVAKRTLGATETLFRRFAGSATFLPAVIEMRRKLEVAASGAVNFKTSAGGIYDIDFLTSYLLVKNSICNNGGTLRERLWRCAAAGVLAKPAAAEMDHAAELFRTVDHVIRLVAERATKWLPHSQHSREATERLVCGVLGRSFGDGLEPELLKTCRQVREIYARVLQ